MAGIGLEELNILKRHSEPYEQYFRTMKLTSAQKKARIALSMELEDALIIFFDYIQSMINKEMLNETSDKQQLTYLLYDVVADKGYFRTEEELARYVSDTVNETYKATIENLAKHPNDMAYDGKSQYWLSEDRAMFIAENEANTLENSKDYIVAKDEGNTWKVWDVYPDSNVRNTHMDVMGATIPIDSYFDVGAAHLLYPKDTTSEFSTGAEHPEEIVNCRCTIRYIKR